MCDCVIHDSINGGEPRTAWGGEKWWLEIKKRGKRTKNIGSHSAADKDLIEK